LEFQSFLRMSFSLFLETKKHKYITDVSEALNSINFMNYLTVFL